MLNVRFIKRKIKLMQEDLSALSSLDVARRDAMDQYAAERILERLITRALDVNQHLIAELGKGSEAVRDYFQTFIRLADLGVYPRNFAELIAPSAGMRNILVHEYDEVDPEKIFETIPTALKQYTEYNQYLLDFLKKQKEAS
ncbi:MAG: DUF86 domain-containing protein [Parcubacteria group bacterium]|nr:DUF86 domain-containing protein [Parcubacteria group bacterium]